jgi:hypothetical protein
VSFLVISGVLSVQLSLLQDAVLATVIALVSVESQLCLLNLHLLGFLGLLSLHHSQETLSRQWNGATVGLSSFVFYLSGITVLCCLIYSVLKSIIWWMDR